MKDDEESDQNRQENPKTDPAVGDNQNESPKNGPFSKVYSVSPAALHSQLDPVWALLAESQIKPPAKWTFPPAERIHPARLRELSKCGRCFGTGKRLLQGDGPCHRPVFAKDACPFCSGTGWN
jgi:hypothetical protein